MEQVNKNPGELNGSQVQNQGSECSEQRDVSYGELSMLEELFDEQVKEKEIAFTDDEQRDEARYDFIQQYIDGDDNPIVRIL